MNNMMMYKKTYRTISFWIKQTTELTVYKKVFSNFPIMYVMLYIYVCKMIIYTKAYHKFNQFEPNNYNKHNNQHKLKKAVSYIVTTSKRTICAAQSVKKSWSEAEGKTRCSYQYYSKECYLEKLKLS